MNHFDAPVGQRLRMLNVGFQLLGQTPSEDAFSLRTERRDGEHLAIIQIHSNATVQHPPSSRGGPDCCWTSTWFAAQ